MISSSATGSYPVSLHFTNSCVVISFKFVISDIVELYETWLVMIISSSFWCLITELSFNSREKGPDVPSNGLKVHSWLIFVYLLVPGMHDRPVYWIIEDPDGLCNDAQVLYGATASESIWKAPVFWVFFAGVMTASSKHAGVSIWYICACTVLSVAKQDPIKIVSMRADVQVSV